MLDWNIQGAQDASIVTPTVGATGILVGTAIATSFGWRPIEAVCCGDAILTFDHGFRSVINVRRELLWNGRGTCPSALRMMCIGAHVLDNKQETLVLPEQGIMVESDAAADFRGDPFAVLMPQSMEAHGLASRVVPHQHVEAIILEFEDEEVVYGQSGLHFHVPKALDLFENRAPELGYKMLDADETFAILEEFSTAE